MTKRQYDLLLEQQNKMHDQLMAIYNDLDSRLDSVEKVLILQEENLKVHMKRSENLEELLDRHKEEYKTDQKETANEIKPLRTHVNMVEGGLKLLGGISIHVGVS